MDCVHMVCSKPAGYTVTSSTRAFRVCNSHLRWAIDMILSSSPGTTEDFRIHRYRPVAKTTRDKNTVHMSVAIQVDAKGWQREHGVPPEKLDEDIKTHVLTALQGGYEALDDLWLDVEVK